MTRNVIYHPACARDSPCHGKPVDVLQRLSDLVQCRGEALNVEFLSAPKHLNFEGGDKRHTVTLVPACQAVTERVVTGVTTLLRRSVAPPLT